MKGLIIDNNYYLYFAWNQEFCFSLYRNYIINNEKKEAAMGRLAERLGLGKSELAINWDMTPTDTFGMFESWGGKERLRSKSERYYYFYIDNWGQEAKLYLMERGIKHAKILARISAPQKMIDACVAGQGKGLLDKNYAIDDILAHWLRHHVIKADDLAHVTPIQAEIKTESLETSLPGRSAILPADLERITLRSSAAIINEEQVAEIVEGGNFFDKRYNPAGRFENFLVDNGDQLTITDLRTGIMWQRGGCDITNIRNVRGNIKKMNTEGFAGHKDWRLPTMPEALSLLEPTVNAKTLYLHPCFSREQPFIFLADARRPGGYWFIDFKQATVFWASGTNPGGFGRVCRTVK